MTSPSPRPLPQHHVLVVDDDEDIREAIAFVLELEGFGVAAAEGVEAAYRQIGDGFRPCVVLLDMHMPGLDGWAFLHRRPNTPELSDVPIVVVSGDGYQREAVRAAGCDFLLKPLRPDVLIAAIARHCQAHG
jgi:DNA-binding NtrC family response regulator